MKLDVKKIDFTKLKGISAETAICLSRCISKMEISKEIADINIETGDNAADNKEVAKQIFIAIINNLYKAEDEIYKLIASYKEVDIENAKKENIIEIIKELLGINGVTDFLQ